MANDSLQQKREIPDVQVERMESLKCEKYFFFV